MALEIYYITVSIVNNTALYAENFSKRIDLILCVLVIKKSKEKDRRKLSEIMCMFMA